MAVLMKALRSFVYAGKRLKSGQEFEARGKLRHPGSDAAVLVAVRHAEPVTVAAPAPAPVVGAYRTRAIAAAPAQAVMRAELPPVPMSLTKTTPAVTPAPTPAPVDAAPAAAPEVAVDLDSLDRDELHALAARRGVKVHHLAGAVKVRQALIEAQQAAE